VSAALAAPHPVTEDRIRMAVQLEGPADALRYELYSVNMVKLLSGEQRGAVGAGWNRLTVDAAVLANGAYYMVITATRDNGVLSPRKSVKLFVLR
jgi:hypothetical protein